MEAYFAAKRRLFDGSLGERPRAAVLNMDDERGVELARMMTEAGGRVLRYGLQAQADVTATNVVHSLAGMRFTLHTPLGERELSSPLVGRPHIYNILAAVATGIELGYDLDTICRAIETCTGAPGRFERVEHKGDFAVVVDYAHTDDALVNVLSTARGVTQGQDHHGVRLRRRP